MSKSSNKSKQIIVRNYSGESVGITYADKEKVSLNLRKLRFETEVKQSGYPADMAAAINAGIQLRADTIENGYKTVLWYIHIKQFGSFWQDFGCKSIDEWLAKFDMPTGSTLASREVMVRLFDRETYLLVGDDVLGDMMFLVSRFQTDPEKKKADYQNIFDTYCKTNDSFDKTEFRKIVNWYVNTNYASKTIGVEPDRVKDRPPTQRLKGWQESKVARPVLKLPIEQSDRQEAQDLPPLPESPLDFVIEQRLCAGCRARDAYIAQLQRLITTELGSERVPERPRNI